jgi:hypothetical protein
MKSLQPPASWAQDIGRNFDEGDASLLEQAAEKLVRLGQQVGVTPEKIVSLLDSGISIRDLLASLASKASGAAWMGTTAGPHGRSLQVFHTAAL